MKVIATLATLSLLAHSVHAWCMNGNDKEAKTWVDPSDQCGNTVKSGDVFVLYDEISGNYIGDGEKHWLTLTKDAPAGFFWQASPSNEAIKYLKGVSTQCSIQNKAWLGHSGRFMAPTGCNGGSFLEFRKWDEGQCKSKWCYQVGLLSGDQPVNGAIANYVTDGGYLKLVGANCVEKTYKWVLKTRKAGVPWKATYKLDELQSC